MSAISLQQIMAARFRTSAHADNQTKQLMEVLGLSTKAAVARLAIGRSLSLGRRLISAQPYADGSKFDRSEEVQRVAVVSGCYASEMLELVEVSLDEIALLVDPAAE